MGKQVPWVFAFGPIKQDDKTVMFNHGLKKSSCAMAGSKLVWINATLLLTHPTWIGMGSKVIVTQELWLKNNPVTLDLTTQGHLQL